MTHFHNLENQHYVQGLFKIDLKRLARKDVSKFNYEQTIGLEIVTFCRDLIGVMVWAS